jgi:hypothetical protein
MDQKLKKKKNYLPYTSLKIYINKLPQKIWQSCGHPCGGQGDHTATFTYFTLFNSFLYKQGFIFIWISQNKYNL